ISQPPEPHRAVVAGCKYTGTIGRHIERRYVVCVFQHELSVFRACGQVPLSTAVVATRRDESPAVRSEPDRGDRTAVTHEFAFELPSIRAFSPDPEMPSIVAAHEPIAGRREHQCGNFGIMSTQVTARLACVRVP